ncbi:hypothetical protein H0H87_012377 [Tephrocybe sp. NHM501043]|nr:hypothetical protein H0H87_012377 [Tephrocybe sp. NHM501043]
MALLGTRPLQDDESWMSPYYRDLVLGTIIPTIFVFLSILVGISKAIPQPKPIQRALTALCAPFRHFLTREEVMEPQYKPQAKTFVGKTRALSILALIEAVGWIGCAAYGVTLGDGLYTSKALIATVTWEILAALATDDREARRIAYFWTLMTFLAHLSQAQVDLFQSWHTRRCYERTRGQLFCSIHYKSLKRQDISGELNQDGDDRKSADLGKIVNLMQSVNLMSMLKPVDPILLRGDTYTVAQRFWNFAGVFLNPVRLTIALVFLYK